MSKRSKTAKRHGRLWKDRGHSEEYKFNAIFNRRKEGLNYSGASADCLIDKQIAKKLRVLRVAGNSVSLKSGSTNTFNLGNCAELSNKSTFKRSLRRKRVNGKWATCGIHSVSWCRQQKVLRSRSFWNNYLGNKGSFYVQLDKDSRTYVFFSMKDVVRFICSRTKWSLLETGRIKGSLVKKLNSGINKEYKVLTFEYRPGQHNNFALGAQSGKNGLRFYEILKQNIPHIALDDTRRLVCRALFPRRS